MSFVTRHRVNDRIVDNFYEKFSTQGDASDFTGEDPGRRALLTYGDGVYSSNTDSFEFTLPFSYLVGQKQLQVFWEQGDKSATPPVFRGWGLLLERSTMEENPTFDAAVEPYYEETSANTVIIYNVGNLSPAPYTGDPSTTPGPGANNGFLFSVPHTALPGSSRNRLVVENQGDNIAIELQGAGDGISFTTPEGRTFLIRPEEEGVVTAREIQ